MISSKQTDTRRIGSGFSLVEVLVVVAIIGALVALLLPAVQQARESARRAACSNNLRQVGIALAMYHDAIESFPTGCTDRLGRQLAWSIYLLPYLEEQNLYDTFDTSFAYNSPQNQPVVSHVVTVYICPTTNRLAADRDGNFTGPAPLTTSNQRACSDYGGMFAAGRSQPYANGVMIYDRGIRRSEIVDGSAHTIIVAEDTGRGDLLDGEWADGENIFDSTVGINVSQDNEIWSDHPAGAQVLLCDGSVHFVDASVAPAVLAPLCTRANGDIDTLID